MPLDVSEKVLQTSGKPCLLRTPIFLKAELPDRTVCLYRRIQGGRRCDSSPIQAQNTTSRPTNQCRSHVPRTCLQDEGQLDELDRVPLGSGVNHLLARTAYMTAGELPVELQALMAGSEDKT